MEHAGGDGSGDGDGDRRTQNPGRGRGGGWAQQHPQEHLRRPRHANNANQSPATGEDYRDKGDAGYEVRNSNLSADAPIFVPRNLGPSPGQQQQGWQRHSVQDRLNLARNQQPQQVQHQMPYYGNQRGQHHQYGYQQQQMHYQGQQYADADAGQGYSNYEGGYGNYNRHQGSERHTENNIPASFAGVLRQLENAMETLNRSPGHFDDLVVPLVCSITPHLKTPSHTQDVVSAILRQSIRETNFRYSGARLCAHLDAVETPADDTISIFRSALFARCREETEAESERWQKEQNEKTCSGLMLSLGELVTQLDPSAGSIIGKLLVQLISVALKNPSPNAAKFICQVLKLSGSYLERDSSTNNREEIERVMRELTLLVTEGRVDVHVGRMVNSVCELRSGNWGRVPSHGPTPVEPSPAINEQLPQHSFNEPVLYGPDGTILSAEESSFCQSRATVDGIGADGGDSDEISKGSSDFATQNYEDDEDDVIAAAYEEFLKLTPNKSGGVDRG